MRLARHFVHVILRVILAGAFACLPLRLGADLTGASGTPSYSAASIVHAATQLVQTLAPNTIATLYGANLSYSTHIVTSMDLSQGTLPTSQDGVTVYVNGIPSGLFYVSPTQINFLIPYTITASIANVYVVRQGTAGPVVSIPLANAAPAFFQWNGSLAVAVHANGVVISSAAPAVGGEIIILFAAGLGRTSPDILSGEVVTRATPILYLNQFQALLNGVALPPASVLYAGLAPGFSGLYQINLQLPANPPANPSIQLAMGSQLSPAAVQLPLLPSAP